MWMMSTSKPLRIKSTEPRQALPTPHRQGDRPRVLADRRAFGHRLNQLWIDGIEVIAADTKMASQVRHRHWDGHLSHER
jgi:hypothetical protein